MRQLNSVGKAIFLRKLENTFEERKIKFKRAVFLANAPNKMQKDLWMADNPNAMQKDGGTADGIERIGKTYTRLRLLRR